MPAAANSALLTSWATLAGPRVLARRVGAAETQRKDARKFRRNICRAPPSGVPRPAKLVSEAANSS
jgi:hypothetical protein